MSKYTVIKLRTVMAVCFAMLSMITGLAACGGGGNNPSPVALSHIFASASPALITAPSGSGTSVITYFSTSANIADCTTSPAGKIASTVTDTSTTPSRRILTTTTLTTSTEFTITCGSESRRVIVSVPPAAIRAAAKVCADEPEPLANVYYYCDCGTGAATGCAKGDDRNLGTNKDAPRRTLADAVTRYNSLTGSGNTIAFCKGGAFDSAARYWNGLSNSSCAAGSICTDIREYSPNTPWSNAKPIIYNATTGTTFAVAGNYGGVRLLNLSLMGDNGAFHNGNKAFYFYRGAHDVTMCNLDMDAFDIAVDNQSGGDADANTKNIVLKSSNITNSRTVGYLGAGDNTVVFRNNWDGNASSNVFDHTIYLSTSKTLPISSVTISENIIHGQVSPICYGAVIIGHGAIDGLLVENNTIALEASQVADSCWGIGINNHTNASHAQAYSNTVISGNTITNSGSLGITISSCPGCVIENNLIIQNWPANEATGINVPVYGAESARGDAVSTANVIRNNTIWFGPSFTGTSTGIFSNTEGVNHIISNNTVSSQQASGTLNCFRYALTAPGSYLFIDNNNCYSIGTYNWEYTRTRANMQASGFDIASNEGNPGFVSPGTNFRPTGTTLVGAGSGNPAYRSSTDITGAPRPVLPALPAIGAYEP